MLSSAPDRKGRSKDSSHCRVRYGLGVLKNRGQSILIIDKNLEALMQLADRDYIMEKGEVVWSGATAEIADNDALKARYLWV